MKERTCGNCYWFVSGPEFDCYVHADELVIDTNGNALFYVQNKEVRLLYTVIKGNKFDNINAASQIDGTSINIEHWKMKGPHRVRGGSKV